MCAFVGLAGFFQKYISRSGSPSCRSFDLRRFYRRPPCRVWLRRLAPSWAVIVARGRTQQVSPPMALRHKTIDSNGRRHLQPDSHEYCILVSLFCFFFFLLKRFPVVFQIWTLQLMNKPLRRGRAGGVPAAALNPTHLKVPPNVKETSSPSTEQVVMRLFWKVSGVQ